MIGSCLALVANAALLIMTLAFWLLLFDVISLRTLVWVVLFTMGIALLTGLLTGRSDGPRSRGG